MKYFIDRVDCSVYSAYSGKPPCKEAKLYKKYKTVGPYEKPNTWFYAWYIEIQTMDDLWNIINKYGKIIIEPRSGQYDHDKRRKIPEWPVIIIYDYYIE